MKNNCLLKSFSIKQEGETEIYLHIFSIFLCIISADADQNTQPFSNGAYYLVVN